MYRSVFWIPGDTSFNIVAEYRRGRIACFFVSEWVLILRDTHSTDEMPGVAAKHVVAHVIRKDPQPYSEIGDGGVQLSRPIKAIVRLGNTASTNVTGSGQEHAVTVVTLDQKAVHTIKARRIPHAVQP